VFRNGQRELFITKSFQSVLQNGDSTINPTECQKWGTVPNRENYMGGDLEGIIKNLEYLKRAWS